MLFRSKKPVRAKPAAISAGAGRRAPYYFLDPGSVGATSVVLNVSAMAVCVLALGYALLAVNRGASTVRADVG